MEQRNRLDKGSITGRFAKILTAILFFACIILFALPVYADADKPANNHDDLMSPGLELVEVSVPKVRHGDNILIRYAVKNTGGAILQPDLEITIFNSDKSRIISNIEHRIPLLLPGLSLQDIIRTSLKLEEGEYFANIVLNAAGTQWSKEIVGFTVLSPAYEGDGLEYFKAVRADNNDTESLKLIGLFRNPSDFTMNVSLVTEIYQNGLIKVIRSPPQRISPFSTLTMVNQFNPQNRRGYFIISHAEFNAIGSNRTFITGAVVTEIKDPVELAFVASAVIMLAVSLLLLKIYIRRRRRIEGEEV